MKKIFATIIFIVICVTASGQSKSSFLNQNKSFSVGVGYTQLGIGNDNFKEGGINLNMAVYGVFIDFATTVSSNHERSVQVKTWENEKKGWAFHVGYQIPICKFLRVIPNLGYIDGSYGRTNGYNWTVDNNGVKNQYSSYGSAYETKTIDYGAVVVLHPCKWLNLNLHANRHTPGVSLSFEYPMWNY